MIKQAKVYKSPGIYKILNRISGDFYIGSSMNVYKRMYQHQTLLRNNRHHSPHLQNAWNKYGQDNFEYIVLEYINTDNVSYLRFVEQQYLDWMLPSYNVSRDAVSPLSTRYTPRKKSHIEQTLPQNREDWQQTKSKISQTLKLLWSNPEYRKEQLSNRSSSNYSQSMKNRYTDSNFGEKVLTSVLDSFSSGANRTSKFSRKDILHIRELAASGTGIKEISMKYESNIKTIRRIVNRETWNFI